MSLEHHESDNNQGSIEKGRHAGLPDISDDMRELPAKEFDTSLESDKYNITIPNTTDQGFKHSPWTDEEQAILDQRLQPQTEQNRRKWLLGSAALAVLAGTVIVVSASVGATGNGTVSFPVNATTTEPTLPRGENVPVAPYTDSPSIPTTLPPAPELISNTELLFTSSSGDKQSLEELQLESRLIRKEYPSPPVAVKDFFTVHMNKMINYRPSDSEVRTILQLEDDQELTLNDFLAAASLRRTAFNNLYSSPRGNLPDVMALFSERTMTSWYQSMHGETLEEYSYITLDYDETTSILTTSTSDASVDDPGNTYKVTGRDLQTTLDHEPLYQLDSNAQFTKVN